MAPARSCLTYAVACDGAKVRTIEGFDGDDRPVGHASLRLVLHEHLLALDGVLQARFSQGRCAEARIWWHSNYMDRRD